jgi:hypothetical protein
MSIHTVSVLIPSLRKFIPQLKRTYFYQFPLTTLIKSSRVENVEIGKYFTEHDDDDDERK